MNAKQFVLNIGAAMIGATALALLYPRVDTWRYFAVCAAWGVTASLVMLVDRHYR